MQNDFEKQVQQKMDELNFVPSEPVWTNIEKEIRKKDKRRFFIWLPIFLLIAGAGLYWNYSVKDSQQAGIQKDQETKINQPSTNHTPFIKQEDKSLDVDKKVKSSDIGVIDQDNSFSNLIIRNTVNASTLKNKQRFQKSLLSGKKSTTVKQSDFLSTGLDGIDLIYQNNSSQKESVYKERFVLEHLLYQPQFNLIFPATEKMVVNTEKQIQVVVNQKYHWVIGLEASLGISNQISSQATMDKSYAASWPGAYQQNPMVQSPYTQSVSYSAGITLKKKLGKSIEFQTGLSYEYLSFNVLVGEYVKHDTTVNTFSLDQYYRNTSLYSNQPASLSNHKNQLHFISVPLKLGFQPFNKVPFTVSAGIILQQLIHSNMLIYDASSGIYYNSSKSLKQFVVASTAGIDYSFSFLKHRFSVGPYINYGLSNTIKSTPGNLYSVNFRASMDIKKLSRKQRF